MESALQGGKATIGLNGPLKRFGVKTFSFLLPMIDESAQQSQKRSMQLRCAYLCTGSISDVNSWSGLTKNIHDALVNQGVEVFNADKIHAPLGLLLRLKRRAYRDLWRRDFHFDRHPAFVERLAITADARLARFQDIDYVVSPSTIPISHLQSVTPVAIWSDATWHSLINFYPLYSNICRETIRTGHMLERQAMERAKLVVFSSQWAADDAIKFYGIDSRKVHVIPFGANLESPFLGEREALEAFDRRDRNECRLLFVGVEWQRKGGPLAVKIVRELNDAGYRANLTIVGCNPFSDSQTPNNVVVKGFLSKADPCEFVELQRLYSESHFFILPSMAECSAIAFAEANAFALPCLARRVGGVETAIRDGVNGQLFAVDAGSQAYVGFISGLMKDWQRLREFSRRAFSRYWTDLNWKTSGSRFRALLERDSIRRTSTPFTACQQ